MNDTLLADGGDAAMLAGHYSLAAGPLLQVAFDADPRWSNETQRNIVAKAVLDIR